MSKELVISANRHETRVALMEDDQLVEVYFQRANEYSLAGSIHKGRVTRVLPGMQSAFVDLGLERDTFLYVSDFLEEHEDIDKVTGDERPARSERSERPERPEREGRERGGRDRDDRDRNRDRRPQQQPVVQATPPPIPVEGEAPPTEAAEAPAVEAAAPQEGAAAGTEPRPAGQRTDGDRNRRGRRRRRRGGRGFPESKYAGTPGEAEPAEEGEAESEAEAEPVAEAAAPEAAAPETAEVPMVLPGESLRKYRGAPASQPPPAPRHERRLEHVPQEDHTAHDHGTHDHGAPELPEPPPAAVSLTATEFDEPVHLPPDNALPDAPVHHPVVEPETYTPELSRPLASEPPPLPPHAFHTAAEVETSEAEASAEAAAEEEEENGPLVAPMLDEDEDLDIQAMILSEIEGESDVDTEAAPSEPGVEAAPAEGEAGSAQVRERGGRYPHRVSRRMRRRGGRGDNRGEARGPEGREARTQEPRGESQPAEGRRPQERTVARPTTGQPSITDLLKEGQEIIVQIAKEPLGQKGARITSHIALPGRYVVFMPTLEHMGVSRKIGSDEERLRLKRILQGRRPGPMGGFITRTAAEGRTEEEIASDMEFLYKLWTDIKTKSERKPAPLLLHHDLDIVERILRDQLTDNFKAIWIDNEDVYEHVLGFVQRFQPALVGKVKMYTREAPIFDSFSVTSELEKALRPKVWLKSGGYIVINQTEALVAIDVNTGKFVGKSNRLEDTIVKTNTEAIKEIVRQIRLRDLGGIIVIDFIDMDERKNRQKVMQVLEEAMRADRAPYKILQFNDFGLVAITRKRVKQSLERTLCAPCPHCDGAGYIKSVQTVVSEILTEARKLSGSIESKDVMLRVHPDVAKVLKSHQNKCLEELEETLRRPVLVKSDPLLHHEKFDLA
jgi:ribonuclease G